MLATALLMTASAVTASAQDRQNGGGGFGQQGGNQQFGGGNRQNRQFGGNNGGGQNGGFNNGGNNNNGDNSQNGGRNRQRFNSDNGSSSADRTVVAPTPAPKVETSKPLSYTIPVMTGPITYQAQPLPKEFSLLMTKSIFSKNHVAYQPDTQTNPAVFPTATVSALVLRGAMREGTRYLANIEDTSSSSKPPTWVGEGDLLTSNGARVTEITLEHIIVEKNGGRRMITIGVNLDAGERLTPTSVATSGGPTASAATGASAVNVTSATGTTTDEEVADMMRRRRALELGQ